MEKRTWYVFDYEDECGLCWAEVWQLSHNQNLVPWIRDGIGKGLKHVNACDTKKDAKAIAEQWNAMYIERGVWKWSTDTENTVEGTV